MIMIIGIGVDICAIDRMATTITRRPGIIARLFSQAESHTGGKLRPVASLAARFAAKEALAKALGAPAGLCWLDAQILTTPGGQPHVELSGTAAAHAQRQGVTKIHISLSHDAGIAAAYVICEGKT